MQSILGHSICGYSAHVYYYVQSVQHVYCVFGMLCLGVICMQCVYCHMDCIWYACRVDVCVWCFFSLDVICIFVWHV